MSRWRKLQLVTDFSGVKFIIWWGKRLPLPSSLSFMTVKPFWLLFLFQIQSALPLISLLYTLGYFLLPYSTLISTPQKLLATADLSLFAKLHHTHIRPHSIWAKISSINTSFRPNWRSSTISSSIKVYIRPGILL